MIAHRLPTIRDAHQICVLKHGSVHEKGTHNELIRLGGIYAGMTKASTLDSVPVNLIDTSDVKLNVAKDIEGGATDIGQQAANLSSKPHLVKEVALPKVSTSELLRLWKLSSDSMPFVLSGVLASIAMGLVMPSFSFILSEMLKAFFQSNVEELSRQWGLVYLGLGVYQVGIYFHYWLVR